MVRAVNLHSVGVLVLLVPALLLAVLAWRQPILRGTRTLPWPADAPVDEEPPGPESGPGEYIP